jgi:hypothetical protein
LIFFACSATPCDNVVEDFPLDQQPRADAATLPVIEEDGVGRLGNGGFEVAGVLEDNVGRFAAQFQAHFFKVAGDRADDEPADFARAGEGNLVHVLMRGQCGPGSLTEPGDDIDHAHGEAGFQHQFAKSQGGKRSLFGGFQHDAIAGRKGRTRFPCRHE